MQVKTYEEIFGKKLTSKDIDGHLGEKIGFVPVFFVCFFIYIM